MTSGFQFTLGSSLKKGEYNTSWRHFSVYPIKGCRYCNFRGARTSQLVYGYGEDAHEESSTAKWLNLDINIMKVETIYMILFMVICSVLPWQSSCNVLNWTTCQTDFYRYSRACLTYIMPEDVGKFKGVSSGTIQARVKLLLTGSWNILTSIRFCVVK